MRVVEAVAPRRLGVPFRWLLASVWVSSLADGIAVAAGPLLVASVTDSPTLIALAATAQWVPPLVFGLVAGIATDRGNRKRIAVVAAAVRWVVLALLVAAVAAGAVGAGVVLLALFAFATADTFATNSSQTFVPTLVPRADLALANSRVMAGLVTLSQLAGAPIGAVLFAAGRVWPFATELVLVVAALVFTTRIALPAHTPQPGATVVRDVVDGLRWVARHAAVRTLVLTIFTFNITFGAAWSVLVIYARDRLGFGSVGFGLITTAGAIGGIAGTVGYGWLTRRVSLGNIMRAGLIIETFTHLALALLTTGWIALIVFAVFGAHAFVWGTTSVTVRQRAVPSELQGRTSSINSMGTFGGLAIGSVLGGAIAAVWGVTGPFWFAFAGSAVFVVVIWRQLTHIAHADAAELQTA